MNLQTLSKPALTIGLICKQQTIRLTFQRKKKVKTVPIVPAKNGVKKSKTKPTLKQLGLDLTGLDDDLMSKIKHLL